MLVETVRSIPLSTLGLPDEIYEALAEDAPFSWGDNDRTLVRPSRVAEHLRRAGTWDTEAYMFDRIEVNYPGIFIDLEN